MRGCLIEPNFYTTNPADPVVSDGYVDEGIAGYIFSCDKVHTVLLYQLQLDGGDHFYTTDAAERDRAADQDHYTYQGIAGWVYADFKDGVPFYRLGTSTDEP